MEGFRMKKKVPKKKIDKIQEKIEKTVKEHELEKNKELAEIAGPVLALETQESPRKPAKLKGFVQTGLLFIGDPGYMVGSSSIVPGDENPFRNWDKFTKEVGSYDYDLPFPDAFSDDNSGRGVILQLPMPSGKFEVIKLTDQDGKITGFHIKLKD
jgi:hypothetical protein